MVFKSLEGIKNALPELLHSVMFYNNGIIYQTTFEQNLNIPKIGENLAELVTYVQKIYDLCDFKVDEFKKIIFETDDISMILLKLGEDTNIALFFRKESNIDQKLKSIRRYLKKIEQLIDMDQIDLKMQELEVKDKELKEYQADLLMKQNELKEMKRKLLEAERSDNLENYKLLSKEFNDIKESYQDLENKIEEKQKNITQIKEEIEKEKS